MTIRHQCWCVPLLLLHAACTDSPTAPVQPAARIAVVVGEALYTLRPDGSDPRLVSSRALNPSWSPDGRRLVFRYSSTANSMSELRVVNVDGSNEHAIVGPGLVYSPDWSPDGSRIMFVLGEDDGTQSIVTTSPEGTGLARIRDRLALDADPAWSPDGQHIAFVSNCLESTCDRFVTDLWVARADGSEAVKLTAGVEISDDASRPTWSPDGQWIAFQMKRQSIPDIYRIRPSGADLERLTPGSFDESNYALFSSPTYSPDGEFLAYILNGAAAPLGTSLIVAHSDGSSPVMQSLSIGLPAAVKWGR